MSDIEINSELEKENNQNANFQMKNFSFRKINGKRLNL